MNCIDISSISDPQAVVTVKSPEKPSLECIPTELKDKLSIEPDGSISYKGTMDDSERHEFKKCFSTPEGKAVVEVIYRKSRGFKAEQGTPSERGVQLSIPLLSIKQADLFETFEDTHFLEMPWNLSECNSLLSESDYPKESSSGQQGRIDVNEKGDIAAQYISDLQQQLKFLDAGYSWEVSDLVYWLDNKISHPDISPQETGLFLTSLIRRLIEERGITLEQLVHDKYRLRKAVIQKIDSHRITAHKKAYQALLLPDCETPLTVNPENCFTYDALQYPYNTLYRGSYKFSKHYYPQVGDLNTEELACAQFLDSMPEVKCWVRNIDRRPLHSFWLQTSSDKFYPDFVCLLKDGRHLVVEYKGADRWSDDDSEEKRDIGGLWEARSEGKCLFVMPKGKDFNSIKAKLI